jgi:hypothetical protein
VLFYVFFVLFYVILCCSTYFLCCSTYFLCCPTYFLCCSTYFCVVLRIFVLCRFIYCLCVYMCTVLLPPGGYPIAVNKYIISYLISRAAQGFAVEFFVHFICINRIQFRFVPAHRKPLLLYTTRTLKCFRKNVK